MLTAAVLAGAAAVLAVPGSPARARLRGQPCRATRRRVLPGSAWIVAGAAGAGVLLLGVGGGLAAVVASVTWLRRRAGRTQASTGTAVGIELADALARITDELRSGSHPAAALAGIDADGPAARSILGPAEAAARLGEAVPIALARARPHPALAADVRRVSDAWALSDRHGVPLADLLAGVGSDLRWRAEFGNRVRAELAGPRATATVLTLLPVLGIGLGQLMGADPIAVLRNGPLGAALLTGGIALTAAGVSWSEHILRAAVPR